jgi:hypothetical protein
MSTRSLLNLGLAILALVLVLVVIYKPGLEPEAIPQSITTLAGTDEVTSIHIERGTRPPLSFIKRDGNWYLSGEAGDRPAAEFQVQALLRVLQATSDNSYPADSLDLGSLGLQPPQATVTLGTVEILFGATEALEDRRYVQINKSVYLINDQYQHLITAERSNFIARKLLAGRGVITRLELPDKTLAYTEDKQWQLTPEDNEVSADAVQQLVDNWQNATAMYVRDYDGKETEESVNLHTRDQDDPVTLGIISRTPHLILARPDWGIQYHMPDNIENTLFTLQEPVPQPEEQ